MAKRTFLTVAVTDVAGKPLPVRAIDFSTDDYGRMQERNAQGSERFEITEAGEASLLVAPEAPYPPYHFTLAIEGSDGEYQVAFNTSGPSDPLNNKAMIDLPRMVDVLVVGGDGPDAAIHYGLTVRLGRPRKVVLIAAGSKGQEAKKGASGVALMEALAAGVGEAALDPSTLVVLRDFHTGWQSEWVLGRSASAITDHFWSAGWSRLRNYELPADPNFTFTWQHAPGAPAIRQYVNLPADFGPHCGPVLELVGRVDPPRAGREVEITVVPNPENVPGGAPASLESARESSDEHGYVRARLRLPPQGGARFRLEAAIPSSAAAIPSGEVVCWRRIFYQLTTMKDAPDGTKFHPPADLIRELRPSLEAVFIEVAESQRATGTVDYAPHLTFQQRRALGRTLHTTERDSRSPFKTNVVFVDAADIMLEMENIFPMNLTAHTSRTIESPRFLKWVYEPTVIRAQYERGPDDWADLANVRVVDAANGYCTVRGDIPPGVPLTVLVRFKYRYLFSPGGGWGGPDGTLFVCLGYYRRGMDSERPSGAELQDTLTHEIGHALGLVPLGSPWHDPDKRDSGYGLRHCNHKDAAGKPVCVMWWQGAPSGTVPRFCSSNPPDNCSHFVITADLSRLEWV